MSSASRTSGRVGLEVHQHEARGVPDLVGEGLVAGHALLGQGHVHARHGQGGQGEAQGVGAVLVDHLQRVDDVALGLAHLAPLARRGRGR